MSSARIDIKLQKELDAMKSVCKPSDICNNIKNELHQIQELVNKLTTETHSRNAFWLIK